MEEYGEMLNYLCGFAMGLTCGVIVVSLLVKRLPNVVIQMVEKDSGDSDKGD